MKKTKKDEEKRIKKNMDIAGIFMSLEVLVIIAIAILYFLFK